MPFSKAVLRKSLFILVAILIAEAIPFALMILKSDPRRLWLLYGFDGSPWWAWIAAAAVAFAYIFYGTCALPVVGRHFFDLHWVKLVAPPFALVTGTMEELWFRRLVMDWLFHNGAGPVFQVIGSAAVFGLAHGVWGLFGKQWRVAAGATLATGILGALLGIVYLVAGRELAPCIWAHMFINLAIEPWLMVAAVSAGRDGWRTAPARL